MLHTEEKLHTVVTGFTCDRCSMRVHVEEMEHQEGHHIDFVGGFTSVFGDGATVQCDLCQDCLKELIKDFARVVPGQ